MAMTRPSVEADRLATVQRAAKYVLSMTGLTKGTVAFGSMDIFPADLSPAPRATPEYTWRWQLAWVWAKAGYFRETMTGTGLSKHREYTLLQKGREALERIAADPTLAAFYVPSKRTSAHKDERPASFYQPPELVTLMQEIPARSPLRLVKEETDDAIEPEPEPETSEEAPSSQESESAGAGGPGGLKDLPVFLERITLVLENFGERLANVGKLGARLDKIESEVAGQGEYMLGILQTLQNIEGKLGPKDAASDAAPVTRAQLATIVGEMTQSFIRDNPQNQAIAALGERIAGYEESHGKLAAEIADSLAGVLAGSKDEQAPKPFDESTLRAAIAAEISQVLSKEMPKSVAVAALVRTAVAEEIAHGVDPIVQAVTLAQGAVSHEMKEDRESLEARLFGLAPNYAGAKKILEKLEKAVLATCGEIKDELSDIEGAVTDFSDHLEKVNDNFVQGGKEFKRQGEEIVLVSKKNVEVVQLTNDAARGVLDAAQAVSREMIHMARARATDAGIPFETALEIGDSIARGIALAKDNLGASAATSLGGGLLRPIPSEDFRPIILPPAEDPKEEKK